MVSRAEVQESFVSLVDGLSLSPALPVHWPGKSFTPPGAPGSGWIEPRVIFNAPLNVSTQNTGASVQRGLFSITLWRVAATGQWPFRETADLELAETIAAILVKGTKLYTDSGKVKVMEDPNVSEPQPEDGKQNIVITARWQEF